MKLFEQEIYVWAKLSHPNVLPLLGYAFCGDTGYPLLISEWMQNGTAWSYVRARPGLDATSIVHLVSKFYLWVRTSHKRGMYSGP